MLAVVLAKDNSALFLNRSPVFPPSEIDGHECSQSYVICYACLQYLTQHVFVPISGKKMCAKFSDIEEYLEFKLKNKLRGFEVGRSKFLDILPFPYFLLLSLYRFQLKLTIILNKDASR